MKYIIILFLFSLTCLSQETYHFDEIATYKVINGKKNEVIYFLYNSSNDYYFAKIEESQLDRSTLEISFLVFDKLFSKTSIRKKKFLKAEILNLNCNYSKP